MCKLAKFSIIANFKYIKPESFPQRVLALMLLLPKHLGAPLTSTVIFQSHFCPSQKKLLRGILKKKMKLIPPGKQ